jgi:hypothetical protein
LATRSRIVQGRLKRQIGLLKKSGQDGRFQASMLTGKLRHELSELRSEFSPNVEIENWVAPRNIVKGRK